MSDTSFSFSDCAALTYPCNSAFSIKESIFEASATFTGLVTFEYQAIHQTSCDTSNVAVVSILVQEAPPPIVVQDPMITIGAGGAKTDGTTVRIPLRARAEVDHLPMNPGEIRATWTCRVEFLNAAAEVVSTVGPNPTSSSTTGYAGGGSAPDEFINNSPGRSFYDLDVPHPAVGIVFATVRVTLVRIDAVFDPRGAGLANRSGNLVPAPPPSDGSPVNTVTKLPEKKKGQP